MRYLSVAFSLVFISPFVYAQSPDFTTPAEKSKFTKTSTNDEVLDYCKLIAKTHPDVVTYETYGKSHEGRDLAMMRINVTNDEKRPVLLVFANIHAGEVDGKDAMLALARDLAKSKPDWLKPVQLLILPNINPDGNDRFGKHRPEQNGPELVGIRENAQGLDLNRDFVKLETPEIRALMAVINKYDPLLVIDCHTTNGSKHRYKLTYDGPRYPLIHEDMRKYADTKMLPAIGAMVKKSTGFDTFYYGNFNKDKTQWVTYPALPRYGVQMIAARGTMTILSESYSHASFEDRVKASYAFVNASLEYCSGNRTTLTLMREQQRTIENHVFIPQKTVMIPDAKDSTILGYDDDGRLMEHTLKRVSQLASKVQSDQDYTINADSAFIFPAEFTNAARTLQLHGIVVEEIRESIGVQVDRRDQPFIAQPGMFYVSANQPLGRIASYLLNPNSEDGLTTWKFFDSAKGIKDPISRVLSKQPILTAQLPSPATSPPKKKFSEADLVRGRVGLSGTPMGDVTWLPDGIHWLQAKTGKLWKIEATTGKAELFVDAAKVKNSLTKWKDLDPKLVDLKLKSPRFTFDATFEGMLMSFPQGLHYAFRDGKDAIRLTKDTPEFPTFSPDGKKLAFVRKGNLFVVEVASGKETQLTTDGGKNDILNGRADWVYEEEIFNRNGKAYWWSPDSQAIAFMQFNDTGVAKFNLAHTDTVKGTLETIQYPKAGDTNPTVAVVVVTIADAKVTMLNLGKYPPKDTVISRVGWTPKNVPYAHIQNRIQSWLDFVTWPKLDDKPALLMTEKTKAWVEDFDEPHWLKDGSMLLQSERDGHKHIYHYGADGVVIKQLTEGNYDVKTIERVDEESGKILFTSTIDRSTATHLASIPLKGGKPTILSDVKYSHRVSLAPKGSLYITHFTNDDTPTQTTLLDWNGKTSRILDTNPVRDREKYIWGKYERTKIKAPDGFEMEAAITYPPDFHEFNRYPIWIMTYGGPHAPTVRDGWGGGRVFEQIVAASGVIVLRVDPRSASGKGAASSWTCYKQLGVQELKDLEAAVDWLGTKPWADTTRVGLSGHSYGGFMACYALTHSKKFSAAIAGAPVTDWRLYDSIYTERYMGLPSDNAEGYDKTSVVKAAKNLHGQLLIVNGLVDDNVHPQNSLQLIDALQKAGKDFEVMVYPNDRHGIATTHYPKTQLNFIRKTMGVK